MMVSSTSCKWRSQVIDVLIYKAFLNTHAMRYDNITNDDAF